MSFHIPLITDNMGPSQRLRVDVGQTGFFAGREFRAYYEFSVALATTQCFRFTSPVDFILWSQALAVDAGGIRLEAFTGVITPSGTWTPITPIGKNRMIERPEPYYTPVATIETGGEFTGGTAVDLIRVRSASQSVAAASVGATQEDERGLPPGTYYIRLAPLDGVNDTSTGMYSISWEERV